MKQLSTQWTRGVNNEAHLGWCLVVVFLMIINMDEVRWPTQLEILAVEILILDLTRPNVRGDFWAQLVTCWNIVPLFLL